MLKLVNVSKYYSSHDVIALGLRKINLELHSNEFVAIVGESGSGKTTLLNVICGIDSYEEGEMYLNGEETSYYSTAELEEYRKKYIAFVFQSYNLIDAYTVLQNVEAPLILAGYPQKEIRARAIKIIERVGLIKHLHHKATKLSGGQKQRVVIARALAKDCPIIAADEPTGNLDSDSAKQILQLLHEISKDKLVILVTHDYEQVKEYASRKIRIFDGEIVEDVEVSSVQKTNLPKLAEETVPVKWPVMLMIAFRNLLSVPKKTIMMVLIFSVFIFFVAMAYGAFNASLGEMQQSGNMFFQNSSITRVVVKKTDDSVLTPADLAELAGLDMVQSVIPRDYVLDQTFWLSNRTNGGYDLWLDVKALPMSVMKDESDLVYGRMPTADNEVVMAVTSGYMSQAKDSLDLIFSTSEWDSSSSSELFKAGFKVVGIIDVDTIHMDVAYSSSVYFLFNEDVFSDIGISSYFTYTTTSTLTLNYVAVTESIFDFLRYNTFTIDNTLPDNRIMLPYEEYPCDPADSLCVVTGSFSIEDFYQSIEITGLTFGQSPEPVEWKAPSISLNQTTYERFFSDNVYQVSIITDSDVGVDGFVQRLKAIDKGLVSGKYEVFYPYRSQSGDPFSAFLQIFSILGTTVTLAFTLVASVLITYVIFKAIINTKLRDYAIFRTIGANQKTIKKLIYFENYLTGTIGFIIVFIIMNVLNQFSSILADILKYYLWYSYLVLLGLALFMAFSVSSRYCRKVFKDSVNKTLKAE
jgi:putative ABC transport system permease protein